MMSEKQKLRSLGYRILIRGNKKISSEIRTLSQLSILLSAYVEDGIVTPDIAGATNMTTAGIRGRANHLITKGLIYTSSKQADDMGAPLRAHHLTEKGIKLVESYLKGVAS